MCYASKNKEKYDKRKAKVERLNTRAAVPLMLEGPAQGEKWTHARCFLGALAADGRQPIGAGQRLHRHVRQLDDHVLMRSPLDRPFQQRTRTQ